MYSIALKMLVTYLKTELSKKNLHTNIDKVLTIKFYSRRLILILKIIKLKVNC